MAFLVGVGLELKSVLWICNGVGLESEFIFLNQIIFISIKKFIFKKHVIFKPQNVMFL